MYELNMLHTQQDKCMNQSHRMTAEKKIGQKNAKKKKTLVNSG